MVSTQSFDGSRVGVRTNGTIGTGKTIHVGKTSYYFTENLRGQLEDLLLIQLNRILEHEEEEDNIKYKMAKK